MKWKKALELCAGLPIIAVFGYGFITYPDAPFKECATPSGYCGKTGKSHTAQEYHAFIKWQTTLFIVLPAGAIAIFILRRPSKTRN